MCAALTVTRKLVVALGISLRPALPVGFTSTKPAKVDGVMQMRCSGTRHPCLDHKLGRSHLARTARSPRSQVAKAHSLVVKAQASPPVSQQDEVEYKDSWSDVQFINMCRRAYGNLAGWQSSRDWENGEETYQGMLEVSRALMKVAYASDQTNSA